MQQLIRYLAAFAITTLLGTGAASAAIIGINFSGSDANVDIQGMFYYDDASNAADDDVISYDEFTDLMFTVTNANGTGSGNLAGTQASNFGPWDNAFDFQIATNNLGDANSLTGWAATLWDQNTGAFFGILGSFTGQASPSTQGQCQLCIAHDVVLGDIEFSRKASVPLPSTLALLGISIIGLARRRRKS